MKSSVYEITGCSGSQQYRERAYFDTMKEAKADAKWRNWERAGMQGKSLREFLGDINQEGQFVAGKSGFDKWRLQP